MEIASWIRYWVSYPKRRKAQEALRQKHMELKRQIALEEQYDHARFQERLDRMRRERKRLDRMRLERKSRRLKKSH